MNIEQQPVTACCPHCSADVELGTRSEAWKLVAEDIECPHCGKASTVGVDEDRDCNYWFILDPVTVSVEQDEHVRRGNEKLQNSSNEN